MNKYELLLDQISQEIPVIELPLISFGFEGNYYNGVLYIDSNMSQIKKREVLSEEYAHFKTSAGTIIDYDNPESRKQELRARAYSIELIVSLDDLIECHEHNLTTVYECADHLEISAETLKESFKYYLSKFGISYSHKNHHLIFSDESVKILDKKIS